MTSRHLKQADVATPLQQKSLVWCLISLPEFRQLVHLCWCCRCIGMMGAHERMHSRPSPDDAAERARPDFLLAGSFTPSPPRGSVVTAALSESCSMSLPSSGASSSPSHEITILPSGDKG